MTVIKSEISMAKKKSTKIMKAVIPVAGKGTRLLPATKILPKELIPIITKPIIHYVIEEALLAGIEQIIFVTSNGKEDIQKYFTRNVELEVFLEKSGKISELEQIQNIGKMVDVITINQKEQLGLGHAILQAKKIVNNEFFAVLLPDDLMVGCGEYGAIGQLVAMSDSLGNASVVGAMEVPSQQIPRYGIINGVKLDSIPNTFTIKSMIEKPKVEDSPSNLAVPGRYVFTSEIFDFLMQIPRGISGEYQLTDAINMMAQNTPTFAHIIHGERFDTGNQEGLFEAIVALALKDPDFSKTAARIIRHRMGLVK